MLPYSLKETKILNVKEIPISSFLSLEESNIDWKTVDSFGSEWKKFNSINEDEVQLIGDDYFDIVNNSIANQNTIALDVGCGNGRWARYLSGKVKFIEAIDPSQAVFSASSFLKDKPNVRVSQASVHNIPFANSSFDFVYSLGVLHHLPDTSKAIAKCREKLKSNGWLMIYLYYSLDNRGSLYKSMFKLSAFFRGIISSFPQSLKQITCDLIAVTLYLPASLISRCLSRFSLTRKFSESLPLSYYGKTSFQVMRNDALDRFGTPLEKRFSRKEIESMLNQNGFVNIQFSDNPPYWHAIAQRSD